MHAQLNSLVCSLSHMTCTIQLYSLNPNFKPAIYVHLTVHKHTVHIILYILHNTIKINIQKFTKNINLLYQHKYDINKIILKFNNKTHQPVLLSLRKSSYTCSPHLAAVFTSVMQVCNYTYTCTSVKRYVIMDVSSFTQSR